VRKGHTLLANLVASGEVPLGLTLYNSAPEQLKQKGAPIESFVMAPAIAQSAAIALLNKAPHPHAAMLFYDFVLNEGQELLAKRHRIPTTNKIDVPLKKTQLIFIDPVLSLDMNEKWVKVYEDTVTKKTK
jgi:iron(III) transport system substrate-binding protein